MKYLSVLLLLYFSLQLNGQELSNTIPNPEPGKIYTKVLYERFAGPDSLHFQLYKISPPVFETVLDTIYFNPYKDNESKRVMMKESFWDWIVYEKDLRNCLSTNQYVSVVSIEKPAQWQTFNFDGINEFKIIKVEKMNTPCTFNAIDNIKNELFIPEGDNYISWIHDKNTYIKTTAGKWTQWKETICNRGCGRVGYTVKQIQEKLKEKAYYFGPINNKLDKATKAALTQLIDDYNLPTYQLTRELLKLLEIEY